MTDASFKVSYVLMCDDIRTETNGKNIIIGLYADNITLPKGSPAFVSPLVFMINGYAIREGHIQLKSWIESPDGRRMTETTFGAINVSEADLKKPAIVVWQIRPWNSETLGHFKVHLTQDDHDEVIFEFEIKDTN